MSHPLAEAAALSDRFVVKKVLSFAPEGGMYVVRDEVENVNRIAKELIPPEDMPPDEVAKRRAELTAAVDNLIELENVHVARALAHVTLDGREYVIMEQAEGVTLQAILDMSIGHLDEKQVLKFGIAIAEAIHFFHNRPQPFVFDELFASHVMVDHDEHCKLINLGIDRFFRPGPYKPIFSDNPADRARDFVRFGRLLNHLLTREYSEDPGYDVAPDASPAMQKLLRRCLTHEANPSFQSFKEVQDELKLILNPPAKAPSVSLAPRRRGPTFQVPLAVQEKALELVGRFLQQPRWLMAAEGLAVILVCSLIWLWLNPGVAYSKSGAMGYVVLGNNELLAISPVDGAVRDRKTLGGQGITDALWAGGGERLILCDPGNNQLLVLDTQTNEQKSTIKVDKAPGRLVMAPDGRTLFCVHPTTRNVTQVSLDSYQMTAVYGIPNVPQSVAVTHDVRYLFVSTPQTEDIQQMDLENGRFEKPLRIPGGAVAMITSPKGDELWVATRTNSVVVFDLTKKNEDGSPSTKATITNLKGKDILDLRFTPDGLAVVALCRESNTIDFMTAAEPKSDGAVTVGTRPSAWAWTVDSKLWVANEGDGTVSVVDPGGRRVIATYSVGRAPKAVTVAP